MSATALCTASPARGCRNSLPNFVQNSIIDAATGAKLPTGDMDSTLITLTFPLNNSFAYASGIGFPIVFYISALDDSMKYNRTLA